MSNVITASRGTDKSTAVASEIRRRIATGELSPGSQLPHRTELEELFQVSKVTLQRVMNSLIEDGLIDATRNKGSFVVERPPHLSRYVLAFRETPGGSHHWARFWMALVNEAASHEQQTNSSIPIFYGIDGHTDTSAYQKFALEVEEQRLAGVIFVAGPPHEPDLSLLKRTRVPGVTIQSEPQQGFPCVVIDYDSFVVRALEYLRIRGRRRVAFICPSDYAEKRSEFLLQQIAKHGLETRPYWIQGVGLERPMVARNYVHLLMAPTQPEYPDALIITDDNLTQAATLGLQVAGTKVPRDMEVIGHANFPWKTPCLVPTRRLGFDVRHLLEACLHSIDLQRRGEAAPAIIHMAAQFEEELLT